MNELVRRLRSKSAIMAGSLIGAGAALAVVALSTSSAPVGAAESLQPGTDATRANMVVTFTSTEYLNPTTFNPQLAASRPSETLTQRWVQLDGEGNVERLRAETRDRGGNVVQIDVNDHGREFVQNGLEGCVDAFPFSREGSSLPQAQPLSLMSAGFRESQVTASEMARIGTSEHASLTAFEKTKPNERAGFEKMRIREIIDDGTGDIRGEFIYLVGSDGSSVLDQSRVNTPVRAVDPHVVAFTPPSGPDCRPSITGKGQ